MRINYINIIFTDLPLHTNQFKLAFTNLKTNQLKQRQTNYKTFLVLTGCFLHEFEKIVETKNIYIVVNFKLILFYVFIDLLLPIIPTRTPSDQICH